MSTRLPALNEKQTLAAKFLHDVDGILSLSSVSLFLSLSLAPSLSLSLPPSLSQGERPNDRMENILYSKQEDLDSITLICPEYVTVEMSHHHSQHLL